MSFGSRFALWAIAIPAVFAFAPRDGPTQTVGYGLPVYELLPTEAPSMELVKKRLQKKAVTNICTEWTLAGGGQPECFKSETCLFTTVGGLNYEGCAQTSINYNWITTCYDYSQVGTAPVSELYCPQSAPYCGIYAFVFTDGFTALNYGCSATAYLSLAYLLPTTSTPPIVPATPIVPTTPVPNPIPTTPVPNPVPTISSVPTTSPGPSPVEPTTTQPPNPTTSSSGGGDRGFITSSKTSPNVNPIPNSSASSSTQSPTPTPRPSPNKAPIGAIVGGVIGGIALLALLAFLAWFFIRKHKQDRDASAAHEIQVQQNQAEAANAGTASAFHNNQHVSEISGKPYAPAAVGGAVMGAYGAAGNEKHSATTNAQEFYQPPPPHNPNAYPLAPAGYGAGDPHSGSQSPPPMYGHSPQLPTSQRQSNTTYPASPHSGYSELDHAGRPVSTMTPLSAVSPAGIGGANELPGQVGVQRGSVSEMSASRGGFDRKPVPSAVGGSGIGRGRMPQMDMSGNPMSEDYHHHELE